MPLLRQSLLDTYLVRLHAIARFWEIPLTTGRQRDVALELSEAMADRQAIEHAWSRLSEDQRRATRALLASEGRMPRRVFAREWGQIRAMGPGRMERERPWEDPVSPAEGLWYRGFLYASFEQGPDGAYEALSIPPEIREHLPAPNIGLPTIKLNPVAPPDNILSTEDRLLDDACTLLAYVHNKRPRPANDQRWRGRDEEHLLARLHVQDQERFAFLRHLATSIGWVVGDEAGRLRLDAETVTKWLQSSAFHQRTALTEVWRDDPTWNDLFHVPGLQPEDTGAWRNDPVLARQAVLRHLGACAPNDWYELKAFITAIKEADPDFQRPAGDYETWYIRDKVTGTYLSGFESWDAVEGRLIRYLVTRPMAWLGLIDVGAPECDRSSHLFRLGTDGAAYLDMIEPPSPPESPPPRLRSGFRISMPAGDRYERFQLARVAEWVQTGERFIYRLTPASLQRAAEQGIPVTRVIEFLQEVTQAPLPRPVEKALSRWVTHGTEARLERALLLRVSDEQLMEQIVSSSRMARLIEERIGPTTALVRQQDWPQIVARLEEIGLLPEVADLSE